MVSFPELRRDHVCVRPFGPHHLTDRYVSWLNDPEVVRFSELRHSTHTLEECRAFAASQQPPARHFLAVEEGLGWHVGNIGVAIDWPNRSADMSIIIGERTAWGRGVASRAWSAVLEELLSASGLRKVTAGTMEVNEPMLRLMSRTLMRVEAVTPRHFLWEGREVALVQAARYGLDTVSPEP